MELTLRKSSDNWYIIEQVDAPDTHREGWERVEYGQRWLSSARLDVCGSADVEGEAWEMLDIAEAITHRRDESSTRCAVCFADGAAYFYSPRNSNDPALPIPLEDADKLALLIRRTLWTSERFEA